MRHGSLINELAVTNKVPTVGDGATIAYWSDRQAATIVEVSASGRKVTVRNDKATRVDSNGMSDAQRYEYETDPEGAVSVFSRRKDGQFREVNGTAKLLIGVRNHYHDFSF